MFIRGKNLSLPRCCPNLTGRERRIRAADRTSLSKSITLNTFFNVLTDKMPLPTDTTSPEFIAARNAAMARYDSLRFMDAGDPTGPCGHAYGLKVSMRLTTDYRSTWRNQSMDVKPSEVMECLREAGVRDWCLMGLHGYVGYLPMPRATQDVDVMVPHNQKKKAVKAISGRWPQLERKEFPPVVRFYDPGERDGDGNMVPVIDLMLPWSPFQETILKDHVVIDPGTLNRHPTLEAAIVSKYAALVSPHRVFDKKQQDATDLGRLIRNTHPDYDVAAIQALAGQVWEGGSPEIVDFIDCALNEKPFPV